MKRNLVTLALLAALPFAANAGELSYNYVEAGYSLINSNPDADGLAANGSYALTDNFHAFGGYSTFNIENTPVDLDVWNLGLGYNYGLSNNTDLLVRGAYEKGYFDLGLPNPDGWYGETGVRSLFASNLEGWALVGYEDTEGSNGDVYGKFGAQVKLNKSWGLVGEVKFIDGDEQYFVGPRLTF
jgi:Ax21 family sulfation-dependent quorum factor